MNLTPLVVVLKPSRILATILLIAHAVSAVLIVLLPLAIWLKLLGIAIIVVASGCQKGTPLAIDTPHLAVLRYIVRVALYSDS